MELSVVVHDEWESAADLHSFFDDPEIAGTSQDGGAQSEPKVPVVEAIATADQF